MTELIPCKNEVLHMLKSIREWMKPTYVSKTVLQMLDTMYLQKEPLGVVLIISPWNYPVYLFLMPLIAAVAAGRPNLLTK